MSAKGALLRLRVVQVSLPRLHLVEMVNVLFLVALQFAALIVIAVLVRRGLQRDEDGVLFLRGLHLGAAVPFFELSIDVWQLGWRIPRERQVHLLFDRRYHAFIFLHFGKLTHDSLLLGALMIILTLQRLQLIGEQSSLRRLLGWPRSPAK